MSLIDHLDLVECRKFVGLGACRDRTVCSKVLVAFDVPMLNRSIGNLGIPR